eukprot:Skav221118  [mRNA]  locus=scaffold233:295702:298726:- [translate_table: standard]
MFLFADLPPDPAAWINPSIDSARPKERYGRRTGAVRRCAEALRRGVQLPVAEPEVLEADMAAMPVEGKRAAASHGSLQRFFVTGSTGLLGRELIRELLARGKEVVAPWQVIGDVSQVNLGADLSELAFATRLMSKNH